MAEAAGGPGSWLARATAAAGLVLLGVSLAVLAGRWATARATVHAVTGSRSVRMTLGAGDYRVYQDPGSFTFAVGPGSVSVTGQGGRARVRRVSWELEPSDVAAPVLGTGLDAPVDGFAISEPGHYQVRVAGLSAGEKVLVGEPLSTAARRVVPPAMAVLISAAIAAEGLAAGRRGGVRVRDGSLGCGHG